MLILATYNDGQIIIMTEEDYKDKKSFYGLEKVGEITTKLDEKELFNRIVYPIAFTECWLKEMAFKYKESDKTKIMD